MQRDADRRRLSRKRIVRDHSDDGSNRQHESNRNETDSKHYGRGKLRIVS